MTPEQKRRLARAHAQQLRVLATLVEDGEPLATPAQAYDQRSLAYHQVTNEISRRMHEIEGEKPQ